jgi:proteasome lid subunit RPN8/RPN11
MGLFENINHLLAKEIVEASRVCGYSEEEQGGIILEKNGEYVFTYVKNKHRGSDMAPQLYETDLEDFKENVAPKVADGWKFFASFHTHPSFSPTPSRLDLEKLFTGFKYNVIFATHQKMFCWAEWLSQDHLFLYYIPLNSLKLIIHHNES